jgi:hypothetical protein
MDDDRKFGGAAAYKIKVKGLLDAKWSDWFDGLTITYEDGNTLLDGQIADQAALYGILAKICDLGLPLLCVKRVGKDTC